MDDYSLDLLGLAELDCIMFEAFDLIEEQYKVLESINERIPYEIAQDYLCLYRQEFHIINDYIIDRY